MTLFDESHQGLARLQSVSAQNRRTTRLFEQLAHNLHLLGVTPQ